MGYIAMRASLLAVTLCLALLPKLQGQGANVSVAYAAGNATFTIRNDSSRDIKAWAIRTLAHHADGRESVGGHTEDYGPRPNPNALLVGRTVKFEDPNKYGNDVTSVTAKVTAIVYDDNTAQATNEEDLAAIISTRKNFAYTAGILSETLREAAMDEAPKMKARADLQLLMAKDIKINKALVQGAINNLENVQAGQERESIQEHANSFHKMAELHGAYAIVRRLQ